MAPGLATYPALTAIWKLPSRFSGGGRNGYDRFLCRIISWRSVWFFIFLFMGIFPGEAG
jgi:hypothetical protein